MSPLSIPVRPTRRSPPPSPVPGSPSRNVRKGSSGARWLAAAGVGLCWILATGCSPSSSTTSPSTRTAPAEAGTFQLAPAESRRLERTISVAGSLLPIDQTPVSVEIAGRLDSLAVDLGSVVRQNDPLARIDPTDYELRLRQAQAALGQARARLGLPLEGDQDRTEVDQSSTVTQARAVLDEALANRDRIEALSKQGILSTSELETANATFKVAQSRHAEALEEARIRIAQLQQRRAEYEIARQQFDDTTLRAPFDGAVQERRANVGEYLSVGTPVLVLVRVDPLRLRVEVAERDAVRVKVGLPVRVSVEGDPQSYQGQVNRLSPAIASGSRTLMVEADIPALGRLRPGAFARAELITQADADAVVVPARAIVSFAGIEKVFVVTNDTAAERRISTGDRGPDWVEVVDGLKPGETVVLSPGSLQAGQKVHSATPTPAPGATPGAPGAPGNPSSAILSSGPAKPAATALPAAGPNHGS